MRQRADKAPDGCVPRGLPPGYHVRLVDAKADHLGYFDPAQGAVPNPGMGVMGYVLTDHMHVGYTEEDWLRTEKESPRPLDLASFQKMVDLSFVDHLYIRVEWRDIQREKGRLSLPDAWKWMLDDVEKRGKGWSFRIMPFSPHSIYPSGLPEFVERRCEMKPYWRSQFSNGPKYFPVYTAAYLDHWQELVGLLGEAFDNHPLLEFVDVSGFGFWGEFHHWASHKGPGSPHENYEPENSAEVIARLVRDHLNAFPRTPAALALHAGEYRPVLEIFEQGLCWSRRDSFMTNYSPGEAMLSEGLAPGTAMVWETILPGCDCPAGAGKAAPGQDPLPQRYFDIRAHYAAMGFNPWDMIWAHEHCRPTLEMLARQIGYRVRPSIIWKHHVGQGDPEIVLGLRNDGCAPVPGILAMTAEFSNGHTVRMDLPAGEPVPGRMYYAAVPCDKAALKGFTGSVRFTLMVCMKGKTRPVQWAIAVGDAKQRRSIEVPFARGLPR